MNKRPNKLVDKLVASNTARAKKDIQQWRSALQQAEGVENPKRTLLYRLYQELVLDAHLSAEMQKRTLAVTGSAFSIYLQKDGTAATEKTELLHRPWFFDFLTLAMESVFWGHSLVQIGDVKEGEITEVTLIDRKHVIPEKGLFIAQESDENGIAYREDRKYSPWLFEIGSDRGNLGLLNKTAPHVLFKRFAQSAWSEFCEIFGMPIRVAKTNTKDQDSLDRMENMMVNTGAAKFAIIDEAEKLEFIEIAKSNGEVYDALINRSNSELSKLINGAVMGEDSKNGSRSKEEVSERTADGITRSDKLAIAGYINYTMIPKLIEHGYPLQGVGFRFEKNKDIQGLWEITKGLLEHKDVANDFITNTFGIPVTDKPVIEKNASLSLKDNLTDPFG